MTVEQGMRARRRLATAERICRCAQSLADERGIDGFTLEDLADAAGVSRRTLFNYFPGKVDAVLGPHPTVNPDVLATFAAGGPHRDLVEDLAVLARSVLEDDALDRAQVALHRRLLRANPRLLAAAHERFETISDDLVAEILRREGPAFDAERARIAARLLVALLDVSMDRFLTPGDDRELADLFTESLRTARSLFS